MKFKVLSVLLLLAMSVSLLTFVGCDSNTGSSEPPQGNEATGPTVSRDGLVVIAENGLSNYRIVYPQKMEALKDAAQRVADAISTASGVELPIVQDQAPGANEYEIRIGDVKGSRVEVLSVYSGFGLKNDADFAVSTVGNTVYIYSTSAQGATAGIDYFLEKVVTTDSYGMMAGVAKDMRTIYNKEENA